MFELILWRGQPGALPLWLSNLEFDHGLRKRGAENMSDFFTCQPMEMSANHAIKKNIHSDQLVGELFEFRLEACFVISLIIIRHEK